MPSQSQSEGRRKLLESTCVCYRYYFWGRRKLLVTVALAAFDVAFVGEQTGFSDLDCGQNSFLCHDDLFVIKTERYLWSKRCHHPSPSRTANLVVHTKDLLYPRLSTKRHDIIAALEKEEPEQYRPKRHDIIASEKESEQ